MDPVSSRPPPFPKQEEEEEEEEEVLRHPPRSQQTSQNPSSLGPQPVEPPSRRPESVEPPATQSTSATPKVTGLPKRAPALRLVEQQTHRSDSAALVRSYMRVDTAVLVIVLVAIIGIIVYHVCRDLRANNLLNGVK
jgi:hypothetical protein